MKDMDGGRTGRFVFTVDQGATGANYSIVQNRVRKVASMMKNLGELDGSIFTTGDLRRTVETRLAAEGVSQEIRAQLQSHGLGGVQARHYDRHDYIEEKYSALETLLNVMDRSK